MVIHLVGHEQHRLFLAAQQLRNLLVVGRKSVFGIDQEQHGVAFVKRCLHLAADFALKHVVRPFDPSARVHEAEHASAPFRAAVVAIPRHAGHRIDDGFALLHEAVKKCRFADVWAAYNGD